MMDNLLTLGQPSYAGQPSYIGITFLELHDTMDELEMIQLLVYHQDGILNLNWKQKEKDAYDLVVS